MTCPGVSAPRLARRAGSSIPPERLIKALLLQALFRRLDARAHKELTVRPVARLHAWQLVCRRANATGLPSEVCRQSFRATGNTTCLKNGGTLQKAKYMADHESARTIDLCFRGKTVVPLDEVERIVI